MNDATRVPAAGEVGAGDELEILHPERELKIADETITVREFSFVDGLTVEAFAAPLVRAIDAAIRTEDDLGDLSKLAEVFGAHGEQIIALLTHATGRDDAWVRGLGDSDGQTLLLTFWAVNARFFMRRLAVRKRAREHLEMLRAQGKQASDASTLN